MKKRKLELPPALMFLVGSPKPTSQKRCP